MTMRKREVMLCICEGLTAQEIGERARQALQETTDVG